MIATRDNIVTITNNRCDSKTAFTLDEFDKFKRVIIN